MKISGQASFLSIRHDRGIGTKASIIPNASNYYYYSFIANKQKTTQCTKNIQYENYNCTKEPTTGLAYSNSQQWPTHSLHEGINSERLYYTKSVIVKMVTIVLLSLQTFPAPCMPILFPSSVPICKKSRAPSIAHITPERIKTDKRMYMHQATNRLALLAG